MTKMRIMAAIASMLLITACGGGGGGGGAATQAVVKLATSGTGTIYGIDVTVNLAEGVTVKSSNPPFVDDGVVSSSSGTVAPLGLYTAASGTYPGKVNIWIANENGFGIGEFCTINSDIAAGYSPAEADFSIASFKAVDDNGAEIITVTSRFTADIH